MSNKTKTILGVGAVIGFGILTVMAKLAGQALLWQILLGATFIAAVITFQLWREWREA